MYIYYILRGQQNDQPIESEGDLTAEVLPDVDLSVGPAIVNALIRKLHAEGTDATWTECDLTDDFFEREDNYIRYHNRWTRRAETPYRKQ